MAIRTVEKTIGDHVYSFNTMNTGKRIGFLSRITKAFGSSITAFFGAVGGNTSPTDVDTLEAIKAQESLNYGIEGAKALTSEQEILLSKHADKQQQAMFDGITKAVELLVGNMDKENVEVLIKDLIVKSEVTIDNRPVNYDNDFDDLGDLFTLLIGIVQENFGSVFTMGSGIKA